MGNFFGVGNNDRFSNLFLGKDGKVYILERTNSDSGIATSNAYISSLPTNGSPQFLAKFSLKGQRFWSTYFKLPQSSNIAGFTEDENGNIYISGYTSSSRINIATSGTYQQNIKGAENVIFFKYNPSVFKVYLFKRKSNR